MLMLIFFTPMINSMKKIETKVNKSDILMSYYPMVNTYVGLDETVDVTKAKSRYDKIRNDRMKNEMCHKIKLVTREDLNSNDMKVEDIE